MIDWLIDWQENTKSACACSDLVGFFPGLSRFFPHVVYLFLAREVRNQTQGRKAGGDPAEPHLQWAADWMVQSRQRSQPHGRCFCCGRKPFKKMRPSRGTVKPLISLCVACFCAAVTVVWQNLDFTTAVCNFHVRKAHFSVTWFFLLSHLIINSAFRVLFRGRKFWSIFTANLTYLWKKISYGMNDGQDAACSPFRSVLFPSQNGDSRFRSCYVLVLTPADNDLSPR